MQHERVLEQKSREDRQQEFKNLFKTENCPSCLEFLPSKATECPSCGVILSQFYRVANEKRMKSLTASLNHLSSFDCEKLETLWKQVQLRFNDQQTHDAFLLGCQKLSALPYLTRQYQDLLNTNPASEIADYMLLRGQKLLESSSLLVPNDSVENLGWNTGIMRVFVWILYFCAFVGVFLLWGVYLDVLPWTTLIFSLLLISAASWARLQMKLYKV